jgi:hypothetical protein
MIEPVKVLKYGMDALSLVKKYILTKDLLLIEKKYFNADELDNVDDLRHLCLRYRMKGLKVNRIPKEKLANAYSNFPIPESEKIIAFLDTTALKSYKTGIALGLRGVYFRNEYPLKSEIKMPFISWDDFKKDIKIKAKGENDIRIGRGNLFYVGCSKMERDDIINLFDNLKRLFKRKNSMS